MGAGRDVPGRGGIKQKIWEFVLAGLAIHHLGEHREPSLPLSMRDVRASCIDGSRQTASTSHAEFDMREKVKI